MQKIIPNLWFDKNAEEAVRFYISIFNSSRIINITYYSKEGYEFHKMEEGTVMTVEFELEGQKFVALNGGPAFKFNEAVSFEVDCETQEEVDYYWEKLSSVPEAEQCGWVKDKYGVSWQIVPSILPRLLQDQDKNKSDKVFRALLRMKKINIDELIKVYEEG